MILKTIIKKMFPNLAIKYSHSKERRKKVQLEAFNQKYKVVLEKLSDASLYEQKRRIISELDVEKATYYIVANSNTKVGIFGYVNVLMPHIAFAIYNGYIPVVDMKNYRNIYNLEQDGEINNSWEMFFQQPCNIGLNDIKGKHVIKCPDELWYRWMPSSFPLMNEQTIALWGKIYHDYVRYNADSLKYLENEYASILKGYDNTIGVIYRGTTYTKGQANGHPIQPTMKMLADKVQEFFIKYGASVVYLASDERSIVDYFEKRFPNRVLINKRMYYDETNVDYSTYNVDGTDITGKMFDRENNEYLIGIEYISSMNLVSKCDYLVAGACGGTTAVLYMNNNQYKDKYIFNLGRYGHDPIPRDE